MAILGGHGGQIYVDQMFNLGGAAVTTLTAMNVGTTASTGQGYSPLADGHLIGVQIQVSPQAATSLAQSGFITLTATTWSPINTLTIPFTGFGLATVSQAAFGNGESYSWDDLMLPVKASNVIKGSVQYNFSPVTPNITVTGRFSTA